MEVRAKVDGEWLDIGATPGTLEIPACENRLFYLSGLNSNTISFYKQELQRHYIQHIRLPEVTTDSQLRQYHDAGLFQNLKTLSLYYCKNLTDISVLSDLNRLEELNLSCCVNLYNFSALTSLTSLTMLDLSSCNCLTDLSVLSDLTNLKTLNLSGCWKLTDISALSNLTNLTTLDLGYGQYLTDLSALSGMKSLTSLD